MGIAARLLKNDDPAKEAPSIRWTEESISIDKQNSGQSKSVRCNEEVYTVQQSTSADKKWKAAHGRSSETGTLRIFVFNNGSLAWTEPFERPFASRIANNGSSVFLSRNDSHTLENTVCIFNSSGESIINDELAANVASVDITYDGCYVAVVTKQPESSVHIYNLCSRSKKGVYENEQEDMSLTKFHQRNDEWLLYLSVKQSEHPLYAIDTDGQVVWKSERLLSRTPFFTRLLKKRPW